MKRILLAVLATATLLAAFLAGRVSASAPRSDPWLLERLNTYAVREAHGDTERERWIRNGLWEGLHYLSFSALEISDEYCALANRPGDNIDAFVNAKCDIGRGMAEVLRATATCVRMP